jgi:hypothetical protein
LALQARQGAQLGQAPRAERRGGAERNIAPAMKANPGEKDMKQNFSDGKNRFFESHTKLYDIRAKCKNEIFYIYI